MSVHTGQETVIATVTATSSGSAHSTSTLFTHAFNQDTQFLLCPSDDDLGSTAGADPNALRCGSRWVCGQPLTDDILGPARRRNSQASLGTAEVSAGVVNRRRGGGSPCNRFGSWTTRLAPRTRRESKTPRTCASRSPMNRTKRGSPGCANSPPRWIPSWLSSCTWRAAPSCLRARIERISGASAAHRAAGRTDEHDRGLNMIGRLRAQVDRADGVSRVLSDWNHDRRVLVRNPIGPILSCLVRHGVAADAKVAGDAPCALAQLQPSQDLANLGHRTCPSPKPRPDEPAVGSFSSQDWWIASSLGPRVRPPRPASSNGSHPA